MVSCASDESDSAKNSDAEGKTVFATEALTTRTSGVYNGNQIDFSWTPEDKLWVNDHSTLLSSKWSNIAGTQTSAKFRFDETLTEPTYPVRYTGKKAQRGDRVTIATSQSQSVPNDAAHIGEDGDCGTAIATLENGVYKFKLDHRAAYITFTPFYANEQLSDDVYVKSIKITANEPLAGTYDFDDTDGIKTSTVTAPSKSITLTLGEAFTIPTTATYSKNAGIMVVAPGTYTGVHVDYELVDKKTGADGYIRQTYSNPITFTAGKNKVMKGASFAMTNYQPNYYAWGATNPIWYNTAGAKPVLYSESLTPNLDASNSADMNTTVASGAGTTAQVTTAPFKDAINVNEAELYAFFGDPHYDIRTMWVENGHIFSHGIWFKKLDKIVPSLSHPAAYGWQSSGVQFNYQRNDYWKNWQEGDKDGELATGPKWTTNNVAQGKPANTNDYFYIPALGYTNVNGVLSRSLDGYEGVYWLSDGINVNFPTEPNQALCLHFGKEEVGLNIDSRKNYYPVFNGATLKQE